MNSNTEFQGDIIGVAIKQGDLVIALKKPNRHHNVICHMVKEVGLDIPCSGQQGFYLVNGKFLYRDEAMAYVKKYKSQMAPIRNKNLNHSLLFSEDLW